MKKSLCMIAISAMTLVMALAANAGDLVITTGSQQGTYFGSFGPRIAAVMETRRFPHTVVTSRGTGENFDRVCTNPHNVALGQADVLPSLIATNPHCPPIRVVQEVASECVFGVTSVNNLNNIDQVADISFNMRVAIPGVGSGSWLTWQNMVTEIPDLADAEIIEADSPAAAVSMVEQGRADMVMFVAFPDPDNTIFRAINDAGLHFLDMSNFDLLQQEVGGVYAYDRLSVTVANARITSFWRGATEIETACTKAVIFTGDPAHDSLPRGERFQTALVRLLETTDPEAFRPSVGWLQSVMNTAANTSRDAMNSAAEAARSFAEDNRISF